MPDSAWANGNLAEVAGKLGKIDRTPELKSSQPRYTTRCDTLYLCVSVTYHGVSPVAYVPLKGKATRNVPVNVPRIT